MTWNDFSKQKKFYQSFWKITLINIFNQSKNFAVETKQTCLACNFEIGFASQIRVKEKTKNFECLKTGLKTYHDLQ